MACKTRLRALLEPTITLLRNIAVCWYLFHAIFGSYSLQLDNELTTHQFFHRACFSRKRQIQPQSQSKHRRQYAKKVLFNSPGLEDFTVKLPQKCCNRWTDWRLVITILGLEHQSLFSLHPEEIIVFYLIKCKHSYHNTIIMQWALIISKKKPNTEMDFICI